MKVRGGRGIRDNSLSPRRKPEPDALYCSMIEVKKKKDEGKGDSRDYKRVARNADPQNEHERPWGVRYPKEGRSAQCRARISD